MPKLPEPRFITRPVMKDLREKGHDPSKFDPNNANMEMMEEVLYTLYPDQHDVLDAVPYGQLPGLLMKCFDLTFEKQEAEEKN